MKNTLINICLLLLITGCSSNTLNKIIKNNNYIVIDVRTKEEYDSGHIVNSINIPYDKIESANLDKNKTIMVYCKSGKRSNIAYNKLKNKGYDVYDLGAYDNVPLEKQ